MGFYDDIAHVERKKRKPAGLGRLIMTSITSAVIGGMVVLLMLPTLSKSGYLSTVEKGTANAMTNSAANLFTQPISVEVNTATVQAVEKVEDAVVGVINVRRVVNWFNQESLKRDEGSGVVFEKKDGKAHIITNNHVIANAERVEVVLPSGDKVDAKVLGADAFTDLAVLEIDGSKVTKVAELGNSSTLKVGEPAIAIGNPLGMEFSRTVTQGIISSLQRSMPIDVDKDGQDDWELDVLQTDAAINPGNSGGALVNIYGQVIGINTLKISQEGIEGLGFAIPINDVKTIVAQLMQYGQLKRPYLGIAPYDLTNVPRYHWKETLNLPDSVKAGVVIRDEVTRFSPAGQAGLRMYDVIVKLDGKEINNAAQLRKYLTLNKKPGDKIEITYYRDGFLKTTTATLGNTPER
ncbi:MULTISPECIES: S1C family serine protease [Bacillales]|jgi:serine protease Do|uniref:Serine protease n=1 Tax=Brevibacillus aydinogluensis TaxID=927786 RepID=A0AA48RB04_9BACL|nr:MULTISPECIES: trypsin-like peptidase domain-containing protein [Bacillales]REK60806.1 MAG: serine protease [Brevibacillus sp.]MBR8661265.1 trypsin-like peptidase domain-containing protein [Brevibacillus sp. NL20B1]MDT3416212.1 serine protease Do [Brevibacillus aydinogluensis]NNV01119.1 PDZ domain-containing protein [Brevibacillus sp. MCWH]UFJ62180.1 trypsin-like peptidase domain-containing protein [Anoxybacillus sediminis]